MTILMVALAGCGESPVLRVGDRLPSFAIEGLDGELVTDEMVRGQVLILHLYYPFGDRATEKANLVTKAHQELQGWPVVFLTAARDNSIEPRGWDEVRDSVMHAVPENATNWIVALNRGPETLYLPGDGIVTRHNEVLLFDRGSVLRVMANSDDASCLVKYARQAVEGTLKSSGAC